MSRTRPITIDGEIAKVPLTRGMVATIDAADVPLVEGVNWHAHPSAGGRFYAARWLPGGIRRLFLHRLITEPKDGLDVDHANGDPLDNRRANLRVCTRSQNLRNARHPNATGYKGVWARNGYFRASITLGGRTKHLGPFATAEEAAKAYGDAAREHFGEFARADG